FPELAELKELTHGTVLDGEIVVMRNEKADFQSLAERSHASSRDAERAARESPATYIIFDILEKDGRPLIDLPLIERKRILKEAVREGNNVVVSLFVENKGEEYYEAAMKKGVEGIVAKRMESSYQPGRRSSDWLKIRKTLTCDCVIFGYTPGSGKREGSFGALILGLYDDDRPTFVGKVGTGFSEEEANHLMKVFGRLESRDRTMEASSVPQGVRWLKPKLVCEVAYQTVTRDGKLRMPSFRSLRADKAPKECSVSQIRKGGLEEYAQKRDFKVTKEPKDEKTDGKGGTFVVQEHHARRLHYDLRLERDGVLKSWAVPKGIPEAGDKRLAIEVEDHPLEYANFEGTIPEGQYGAGTVKIWDKGSYDIKTWEEGKIEFTLKGTKLDGRYLLTRLKKAGEKGWLLLKARD
ncbi:MAG TPA: non-homologous end-joining DNA ligase, partial [Candidatus Bathyarchaeia archaeon]|nr:non-homologous end-joining DNA ligase [Candidatus Bathyarchaeia archaeon]